MKKIFYDGAKLLKAIIDAESGFLTAPVTLARVGVQYYYGYELGLKDRAMDRVGVFRPPEEVSDEESIQSFINIVATDNHPKEGFVTTDNVKDLQKGQVSGVEYEAQTLSGVITITDSGLIKKIKDGKKEVSVGYSNELKEQTGIYDGESYEYVQTNIRANHLAVVDAGRCGSNCKLTIDKETKMKVIVIDGISFSVEDDQLAQAIQKSMDASEKEKKDLKEELDEEKGKKEAAVKEKEKAEATKDAMEKSAMSDGDVETLISDRAELISIGKRIIGDKMPTCMDCPSEIKVAVIDHVIPDMDLAGKSDDYVDAAFDMAVKQADKASESIKTLSNDFEEKIVTKDGAEVTRESARKTYMKDQLNVE